MHSAKQSWQWPKLLVLYRDFKYGHGIADMLRHN